MNVLYPLGTGSTWNNSELRYSLRSLELVRDLGSVFVVGENPGFISDEVTFIPTSNRFGNPATAIMENVRAGCLDERVPERFLLMNDDYFFCGGVGIENYPYYHIGPIKDKLKTCPAGYYRHLFETQNELHRRGLSVVNFDSHYPMIVEKSKMLDVIEMYDWNRQHGFTLKSIYCNTLGIEGEYRADCKVGNTKTLDWWVGYARGREMFSIDDIALTGGGFVEFISKAFPKKCIFET